MLTNFSSNFYNELQSMPRWERPWILFWLLGPFILLIERTPADIWLSFISIAFLVRSALMHDWMFLKLIWVRAAFAFWGVCLFAALISAAPSYSLGETLVWFRFPLFAMATVFWLVKSRTLLYAMLISTAVGMMVMCGILVAEFLILGGGWHTRLSWPYGDLVPGNYLAKAGLPAFVIMAALAMSRVKWLAMSSVVLVVFNLFVSFLAGERINFIIRFFGAGLALLVWRPIVPRLGLLALLLGGLLIVVHIYLPNATYMFTDQLYRGLSSGFESDYLRVLGGGWEVFQQAPWFGIGPGNYRDMSAELLQHLPHLRGDNHPHNFYLQMLADVGIFGLLAGTFFLWSIVWRCFQGRLRAYDDVICATAFIVPLGMFWPIATTADFFGQWNNIFMWSAVALALAASASDQTLHRKVRVNE